jgi:hypothetical protein
VTDEEKVKRQWPDATLWTSQARYRAMAGPWQEATAVQPLGAWRGSKRLAWADAARRVVPTEEK